MCGFAGFITDSSKNFFNKKVIKDMNDALVHRGPDGEGFYLDDKINLSHKRLSIIDLNERSNQPLVDLKQKHIIVFNGEIYNYVELKKTLLSYGCKFTTESDTEVLLKSYIYWGDKFLEKIKGMFAFVIYDLEKNLLFCARDHFGQKPFYYYHKDNNFIFSSELRSLLKNPTIEKRINIKSTIDYLHYDSFVGSSTPIENCYKLLPSEYLIYDLNKKSLKKNFYWNLDIKEEKKFDKGSYPKFLSMVENSVKIHLRSDVPIALYLSGGLDSTSLSIMCKKKLEHTNIHAFNLKFKEDSYNEHEDAKSTANLLGIKLKTFEIENDDYLSQIKKSVDGLDEPLADLGYMAIYLISNLVAKEGYKVAISGDGGDELLMGYEPFNKIWLLNMLNHSKILSNFVKKISNLIKDDFNYMGLNYKIKIFSRSLNYRLSLANTRWISAFMPEQIDKLTKNYLENSNDIYSFINNLQSSISSKDLYDKFLIQYQRHFLNNIICSHTDKANMLNSIEARSPFLDHELFDFVNQLPISFKKNFYLSKLPLRKFLRQNLQNKVHKNKKKGFTVPMAKWIQSELKELIFDIINKENVEKVGFINYNYLVEKIINPHLNNKSNNHKQIWNIFILINWIKNNID